MTAQRERLAFVLILLGGFALRAPTLVEPWGADPSIHAYIASGMLDGTAPYLGRFSPAGYGTFFLFAGLFKLFGVKTVVLPAADLVAGLLSVLFAGAVGRRLAGPRAGLFAAVFQAVSGSGMAFSALYEMWPTAAPYWAIGSRESFMAPLLTGALLAAIALMESPGRLHSSGSRALAHPLTPYTVSLHTAAWTAVGVLVGLSSVLKLTAGLFLPVFAGGILLAHSNGKPRSEGISRRVVLVFLTAGLTAGFIAAQLPFLFYFFEKGAFGAMVAAIRFQTGEYATLSRTSRIETFTCGHAMMFAENLPVWILAFVGAIGTLRRRDRGAALFAVLVAAGAIASIWIQGKFFGYHYPLVLPFLSVLAGVALERDLFSGRGVIETIRSSFTSSCGPVAVVPWALLAAFAFLFSAWNYPHLRWDLMRATGTLTEDQYFEHYNEFPHHESSLRATREVALWLNAHAPWGATLGLVHDGGEVVLYQWTSLRPVTRFATSWFLFADGLRHKPATSALRDEFIRTTTAARPDYLLLVYYSLDEWPTVFPLDRDPQLLAFRDFIRNEYSVVQRFRDGRELYRRLDLTGER